MWIWGSGCKRHKLRVWSSGFQNFLTRSRDWSLCKATSRPWACQPPASHCQPFSHQLNAQLSHNQPTHSFWWNATNFANIFHDIVFLKIANTRYQNLLYIDTLDTQKWNALKILLLPKVFVCDWWFFFKGSSKGTSPQEKKTFLSGIAQITSPTPLVGGRRAKRKVFSLGGVP